MKRMTLQKIGKAAVLLARATKTTAPQTWNSQLRRATALLQAQPRLRKVM